MAFAFAMTIPGLAVALVVLGAVDVVIFRRSGGRLFARARNPRAVPVAYDEAAAFFTPSKRIELEQRQSSSLLRQSPDDGAPPRTRIDFDAGTARLPAPPSAGHGQ
jgi:Family of unknown function (DUF6191)